MIDFRKQIKRDLKKQKISVPKLAANVGCNQQTIYNWLQGRTPINSDLLEKIINLLNKGAAS